MSYIPNNPRIVSVEPLDGYKLALVFRNGERGIFDCNEYLDFGVFRELKDEQYFRKVRVLEYAGTVCWPHGQDFCPDSLYVGSKKEIK